MQDSNNMFDTDGDLPTISGAATGTFVSTKSVDTLAVGVPAAVGPGGTIGGPLIHDIGRGHRMRVDARITTTYLAAAGASTMEVDFITSATADLATPTVLWSTPAIAKATLVAGYRYRPGVVPPGCLRYVGVQYVIATNPATAGKISSGLMADQEDHADILG